MSRFDAAMKALNAEQLRFVMEPTKGPELEQIQAAIQLLEAAGETLLRGGGYKTVCPACAKELGFSKRGK